MDKEKSMQWFKEHKKEVIMGRMFAERARQSKLDFESGKISKKKYQMEIGKLTKEIEEHGISKEDAKSWIADCIK